ncbi:MAG TPA: tannase/feruloyl esterase family alpha/beta hydrolase [Vicinamibacterales bacterium]|nr:tannase/feruloyl esterase family alpha/beta hydrolase [Vicinamibacterales bacterium]
MLGILSLALLGAAAPPHTCDSLAAARLPQTTITSAMVVPAGPFVQPGAGRGRQGAAPEAVEPIPEHCRVKMVLKPTPDSNINVELWMPTANWNGRFLAVGNGGFAGSIQGYGDMQIALRRGYATAATDTGHSDADGPGGVFGLGHPEKIVDFAYRAVHEMTVKSKQLVDEFYGRTPRFSYFKGCSTGGRQAAMAAQRFPDDYDGIIAGALANRHIQMHTAGVARSIELARHPERTIPEEKAKLVNNTVMNACDALKEGFLNNPRECKVDFSKLACAGADSPTCLTAPQLKTVETFYGGLKNSTGELIFSGQAMGNPIPALRGATGSPGGGYDTVRIWGFQDANYDWHTFDLDRDMPIINKRVGFVDAVSPDLRKFKSHGGKLLLYAGWRDTTITPENTVFYYENLVKEMGDQKDFARLFMVPGMAHCRGGDGPDSFDTIAAMEQWREQGVTPTQMMGTNQRSGLSRPLCPYPQYAKYKGSGDLKDAKNWACTAP